MESELEQMSKWPNEKGMTTRIKEAMAALVSEISLLERLEALATDKEKFREDAVKAQKMASRLEKRLQRAYAAASSAFQMEVKEEQ